ncbi:polysaccharide deacetylase [Rothia nasimurium]|uniref:polysaccharide deacetylase n=1 Tax=Rothia nasimurium TaxID=85336 RepID=UPI001F2E4FDE|nr:polysaccharide deacetylase [Rothia nasimurium]
MFFSTFPTRLVTSVAVSALALATFSGCGDSGSQTAAEHNSSASSASPSINPEEAALKTATTLAASYDYAEALAALEGFSGESIDRARSEISAARDAAVLWEDNSKIAHVFVHSLIVDTSLAYDGDYESTGYDDYMVSIEEFEAILEQLYANDYVLINPEYISQSVNGEMTYQDIYLPAGKKPLVLSQDDPNYYEYMEGDGFAANLTLNEEGQVKATYVHPDGREEVGDFDMVPIVDRFVEEHPDFSYRGSKGILAVTGYSGVFGYRTSEISYPDSTTRETDIQKATDVSEALKADGWRIASHSWGHPAYGDIAPADLAEDARKWDTEVRPIIGDTNLLIYPFGSDIAGIEQYAGPKWETLSGYGFDTYFNVDASTVGWAQLYPEYHRQARINLDGIRFKYALDGKEDILNEILSVEDVVDYNRPSLQG